LRYTASIAFHFISALLESDKGMVCSEIAIPRIAAIIDRASCQQLRRLEGPSRSALLGRNSPISERSAFSQSHYNMSSILLLCPEQPSKHQLGPDGSIRLTQNEPDRDVNTPESHAVQRCEPHIVTRRDVTTRDRHRHTITTHEQHARVSHSTLQGDTLPSSERSSIDIGEVPCQPFCWYLHMFTPHARKP
jgi:hypothetical protein